MCSYRPSSMALADGKKQVKNSSKKTWHLNLLKLGENFEISS